MMKSISQLCDEYLESHCLQDCVFHEGCYLEEYIELKQQISVAIIVEITEQGGCRQYTYKEI